MKCNVEKLFLYITDIFQKVFDHPSTSNIPHAYSLLVCIMFGR